MAKAGFLDNVREWIGGIAFSVYLWSVRMTLDEFWAAQEKQAKRALWEMDAEI